MTGLNAITLLINAVMLPLAVAFLVIILWNDIRKELNQFFAVFLFLVILWNGGSLLAQGFSLVDPQSPLLQPLLGVMELGFTGSTVAIYVLTAVIVKAHTRRFRTLALVSVVVLLIMRLLPIIANARSSGVALNPAGEFSYQAELLVVVFYVFFDWGTLYLLWRYRRKVRSRTLVFGIALFVLGQSLGFLNPELQIFSLAINVSALSALVISFAILGQEIISPLAERNSQVEAIRKVNVAITSQAGIDLLLNQIATLAADLLGADGVGIFLRSDNQLQLAYAHELPNNPLRVQPASREGIAGTVTESRQSVHLDDYSREWRGVDDLPFARETFGSVICTPLLHGEEAIGALMVVAAQRHGRLFWREDVTMLELLGAQAAVAIVHNRLFKEQAELTGQVEIARSQLEAVLDSTESPVVAIDRSFKLIFANPAAKSLFSLDVGLDRPVQELFPTEALPPDYLGVLRHLRRYQAFTYELTYNEKVYLCSLTCLGRPRIRGWVAVLNDVTQLKELDRIKSEMVRMTSHDLKNPLQAAMANLELLQDDLESVEDEEVWLSVKVIDKQLQRMERIIRGILDLERVKSGVLSLEMRHPSRIVQNVIYELRERAVDGKITLHAEVDEALPEFACDVEQFERAIINLVENAIKFTPPGGSVLVRVRRDDDCLQFAVEDTGVGIDKDLQGRVFDRFYRANQKGTEHVSGSGLGLSLVKAVVENHRGKVWLESEPGMGTTFFVAIPIDHVKQEQHV